MGAVSINMRCYTVVTVVLFSLLITVDAVSVKKHRTRAEKVAETNSEKENDAKPIVEKKPIEEENPVTTKKDEKVKLEEEKPTVDKVKTEEEKVSYENTKVIRITLKNKQEASFIKALDTDGEIETWLQKGKIIDAVIRTPATLKTLDDQNLQYEIVIDNLQRAIDEENPQLSDEEWSLLEGRKVSHYREINGYGFTQNLLQAPLGFSKQTVMVRFNPWQTKKKKKRRYRLTWQMYHRMNDIHTFMDYLAATYPNNVTIENIGQSVEGRPLRVLHLSSGQKNRPGIWVDAGIHAREWITPASLTYIISQMIEAGDGHRNVDWYFQPLINPDGYEHSHSRDRLWRKNRAHPEKGSCAGIDLNRNFGYKWGGQGASKQPCRETFAGSGPFSEPETAAIQRFITSKQGQIKGYVSLHSYGQYILYPWGYDRKVPADYQDLERVGRAMAAAIRSAGGPAYTVGAAANTLYPASGGSDDWAKGSAKVKYSYTLELRDTGRHGFVLPAQYIIPAAKDAYAALDVLARELAG